MDPPDLRQPNTQSSLHTEEEIQDQDYQVNDSHPPIKGRSPAQAMKTRIISDNHLKPHETGRNDPPSQGRETQGSNENSKNSAESTQPFPPDFYVNSLREGQNPYQSFAEQLEKQPQQPREQLQIGTDKTYATGDAGHIDLHSTKHVEQRDGPNLVEEEIEQSDDDDLGLPRLFSEPASQFPEDRRFKTPKAQVVRGKKRDRRGDIKSSPGATPTTTPRVPVNPFGGFRLQNAGAMSMSQAFKATQAPSSPMLQIPTSDGMSERPSPHLYDVQNTKVGFASSPVQVRRPSDHSYNDPHEEYLPLRVSQEEREKRTTTPTSNSEQQSDSIDLMAPDSSDLQRQFHMREERRQRKARDKLPEITAMIETPAHRGRGRGRGRGKDRGRGAQYGRNSHRGARAAASGLETIPSSPEPSPETRLRSSKRVRTLIDEAPQDTMDLDAIDGRALTPISVHQDSDETQIQRSDSLPDELLDEDDAHVDQENIQSAPIQVPRTVTRGPRHFRMAGHPDGEEPGLSPYRTESQQEAMDSRPDPTPTISRGQIDDIRIPDSSEAVPQDVSRVESSTSDLAVQSSKQISNGRSDSQDREPKNSITTTKLSGHNGPPDDEVDEEIDLGPVAQVPAAGAPERISPAKYHAADSDEAVMNTPTRKRLEKHTTPLKGTQYESLSKWSETRRSVDRRTMTPLLNVPESPHSKLQSPRSSSEIRRPPRQFGDILPDASQASLGLELDLDILKETDEDKLFKDLVHDSPTISPVKSIDRRLRRSRGANQASISFHDQRPNAFQPSNSHTEVTTNEYFTAMQSTGAANAPPSSVTSPEQTLPSSQPSNVSEKENFHSVRTKRRIIESTQDTDQQSEKSTARPTALVEGKVERGNSTRKRPRAHPPRIESSDANGTQSPFVSQATNTQNDGRRIVPTRVWARFDGTPSGYYPAICLEPVEGNKFKVRFDDHTESVVPATAVRRLEMREGDTVKVYNQQAPRKQNFVVVELVDRMQSVSNKALTLTDMCGWTKVKLAKKNKHGELEPYEHPVQVKDLYLTLSQFNGMSDRSYIHPEVVAGDTRPATPSTCLSNPETPASRHLRPKFSVNKVIEANQSFGASGMRSELFSGMAFAATGLDHDTKAEMHKLVSHHDGQFLENGLIPLFDQPEVQLTQSSDGIAIGKFDVKRAYAATGFTAVISNKYSRTTTYLCALALNIPCLTVHWIRDCVKQGRFLDWRRYLLAAGESKILDGAIISRSIEFPVGNYQTGGAIEVSLQSMFDCRNVMTKGQNVLLVSEKTRAEHGSTLTFVAYALGAGRVCFANGIKEANDFLDDERIEWDLVCLITGGENSTGEGGSTTSRSRRRKSQAASQDLSGLRVGARTKLTNNEDMCQSLVLGRLVVE